MGGRAALSWQSHGHLGSRRGRGGRRLRPERTNTSFTGGAVEGLGDGSQSSFRLPNTAAGTLCCSRRTSGGEARRTRSPSRRGSCPRLRPPPRLASRPLTVGLQVHLVLVLAQLDLLRVGLLGQLGQLLPGGVTPGEGRRPGEGATRLSWARQPPSLPAPPLLKSWLAPSPAPPTRPHLTNRILLWAREGWSCSASAASCSARCSSSFMSSMPLCPGARSDTAGEAWGSDAVGRLSSTTALGACVGLGAAGRPPTWA